MSKEHGDKQHNPSTCLSCRFGQLLQELYPQGVTEDDQNDDVLPAVAHLAGFVLMAESDKKVRKVFKAILYARKHMRERATADTVKLMLEGMRARKH